MLSGQDMGTMILNHDDSEESSTMIINSGTMVMNDNTMIENNLGTMVINDDADDSTMKSKRYFVVRLGVLTILEILQNLEKSGYSILVRDKLETSRNFAKIFASLGNL